MRVILLFLCGWCSFAQNGTAVRIDSGPITGRNVGGVNAWLGIPYAAPPVGDLRWRPPQLPGAWESIRAMEQVGPACIQAATRRVANVGGLPESEDCLTLNVWSPKDARQAAVMVWFHGGAYVEGTGGAPIYDGAALARKGVVVVTLNYRLGELGFFAHSDLTRESPGEPAANFGLMDQIAALRWVRRNIAAFGGDPLQVTVFGESSGATSVYMLMISPPARGLFARAIAESGPIFGGPAHTLAWLERQRAVRARLWGAADLKALRALPAGTFTHGGVRDAGPVIDGKYVLEEPRTAFAEGRQAAVPFLLGSNSFEASLMPVYPEVGARLAALASLGGEKVEDLYGGDDPRRRAQQIFTDFAFLEPARFFAAHMEKVGTPAYLYCFSYVPEQVRTRSRGADHGGEIRFVFGNLPRGEMASMMVEEADRRMAQTVSSYWVNFAKTGNPNGPGLPEWPVYRASTSRLLELGPEIAVRIQFRGAQLDAVERARSVAESGKTQ